MPATFAGQFRTVDGNNRLHKKGAPQNEVRLFSSNKRNESCLLRLDYPKSAALGVIRQLIFSQVYIFQFPPRGSNQAHNPQNPVLCQQ